MKNFILLFTSTFLIITCINPPRSNEFDPQNPDKAEFKGRTYNNDNTPLSGAVIYLMRDNEIIKIDTSDASGEFEFIHVDPGIYKVLADAEYFSAQEFYPESLSAGTHLNDFNIYFSTFDFEDDTIGDSTPYGFNPVGGIWAIENDSLDPEKHSVNKIYNGGADSVSSSAIAIYEKKPADYLFETNFKVFSSSDDWSAGIVIEYQNPQNYYLLRVLPDSINLYKIINGNLDSLRVKYLHFSKGIWYRIGVQCQDNYRIYYLNNEYLYAVLDKTLNNGFLGLYVKNGSVHFDDVTIQFK